MAREFPLSVVAPDKSIVETMVATVVAPAVDGYFGVLAGHAPYIVALKPGLVEYSDSAGARHYVYVGGGFAEVSPDGVTVLADEAARSTEIDVARAERDLESARHALRNDEGRMENEAAVLEVERAVQRLRAARIGK